MKQFKILYFLFFLTFLNSPLLHASKLPSLGNSSEALVSTYEEKQLGKAWLRALRRNTKSYDNPLVKEYLTNLLYKLAPASDVIDKDFILSVIDSPTLNAFAVPGSIIGVNAGLLIYTLTEHELASVIAHELAHLSQRHFARQLEQQENTKPIQLIGMLATAILLATAESNAAMLAATSTEALMIDRQLRFSRKNEQEADRIGLDILYQSGFDPLAMPKLFERMHKETSSGAQSIPEYLSTHPLSENRISDTKTRATQLARKATKANINFYLCRAMILSDYSESKLSAAKSFEQNIKTSNQILRDMSTFGLAYSLLKHQPNSAKVYLDELKDKYKNNIIINSIYAEALKELGLKDQAIEILKSLLEKNLNNVSISYLLAEHYQNNDQINDSIDLLRELSKHDSLNPTLWYHLAENYGIAGDIVNVHLSRAEYYFQTNRIKKAIEQLNLAKKKTANDLILSRIQNRLSHFIEIKNNPRF